MQKYLILSIALLFSYAANAQDKDTLEVQKIGDKYYVIMDHARTDSTIQAVVKTATTPKKFDSHFMVVGLGTLGFAHTWSTVKSKLDPTQNSKSMANSFGNDGIFEFSPMFVWRQGDNLLVEFEPSWDGNGNGAIGVDW